MAKGKISKGSQKNIANTVDALFDKLKARFLGPQFTKNKGKGLFFSSSSNETLGSMIIETAYAHHANFNEELKSTLEDTTSAYIDAAREKFRAKVLNTIQSSTASGMDSKKLGESLQTIFNETTNDVKRIVETETSAGASFSGMDAIGKIASAREIEDPSIFWVSIHDNIRCKDCTRLYTLEDQTTPRVWKQSELASGYFKRGMNAPTHGSPIHPSCRCRPSILLPSWGFNASGNITYISPGYDAWKAQHGL
jgi:hypothetical protein